MPRFSLRTLVVVMLLGGPVLAGAYLWWQQARPHAWHLGEEAVIALIVGFFSVLITAAFLSVVPRPSAGLRLLSLATTVMLSAFIGWVICPAIVNGREEAAWHFVQSILASAVAGAIAWAGVIRFYKPEVVKERSLPARLPEMRID